MPRRSTTSACSRKTCSTRRSGSNSSPVTTPTMPPVPSGRCPRCGSRRWSPTTHSRSPVSWSVAPSSISPMRSIPVFTRTAMRRSNACGRWAPWCEMCRSRIRPSRFLSTTSSRRPKRPATSRAMMASDMDSGAAQTGFAKCTSERVLADSVPKSRAVFCSGRTCSVRATTTRIIVARRPCASSLRRISNASLPTGCTCSSPPPRRRRRSASVRCPIPTTCISATSTR